LSSLSCSFSFALHFISSYFALKRAEQEESFELLLISQIPAVDVNSPSSFFLCSTTHTTTRSHRSKIEVKNFLLSSFSAPLQKKSAKRDSFFT
jgi:hypothetical protein